MSLRLFHDWRIWGLIVVTAIAVITLASRLGRLDARAAGLTEETREVFDDAVSAYTKIELAPVEALADPDTLRLALADNLLPAAPPAMPREDVMRVAGLAADFLYHRFGQSSSEAYILWRDSLGDRRVPTADLLVEWEVGGAYRFLMGHGPDPGAPFESLFADMWPTGLSIGDGANQPTHIALSGDGLACSYGAMIDSHERPRITSGMGQERWYGVNAGTMRSWWTPPFDPLAELRAGRKILCVEMGFLIHYQSGDRRPMILTLVKHPRSGSWHIYAICSYNFADASRLSPLEY